MEGTRGASWLKMISQESSVSIIEIDPAVWPEISPKRREELAKLVEKHLIDSSPERHVKIISAQQFTCNRWLYESGDLCLKILDHYDLKLEEPSDIDKPLILSV